MCGLQTHPRTDIDPLRFLPPSNCHRRGAYHLAATGVIPCYNSWKLNKSVFSLLYQLTTQHCLHLLLSTGHAATNQYLRADGPTAANLQCSRFAAVGPCWDRQTERQTDTVPFHRGPPLHTMQQCQYIFETICGTWISYKLLIFICNIFVLQYSKKCNKSKWSR